MARHNGKNGIVTLDSGAVAALTGWDIEETVDTTDLTAAGDAWKDHDTGIPEWKGSIRMNADHGAAGQGLRAGTVLDFEGYTEGDDVGKTYFSGSITITSVGLDSPFEGAVTRNYSFMGKGALSIATVAV